MKWCGRPIAPTRIVVEGKVIEEPPKTERGKRTLPLDADTHRDGYTDPFACRHTHDASDPYALTVHSEPYTARHELQLFRLAYQSGFRFWRRQCERDCDCTRWLSMESGE